MTKSGSDQLWFYIIYEDNKEIILNLRANETIADLKIAIFEKISISPHKQIIDSWSRRPGSDRDTLRSCCEGDINYLVLYNSDYVMEEDVKNIENIPSVRSIDELEECASLDFIEYFSRNFDDNGILFHACRLENAISQACRTSLEAMKIVLLYFHNKNDNFSNIFGQHLTREDVKEIIKDKFFLLGWDIENELYHPALKEALSNCSELSTLDVFLETKHSAAFLIVPIKKNITLFSCMKNKISKKDFIETLEKAKDFFLLENEIQSDLAEQTDNDLGSVNYQQLMLNMLGDRDFDSFDHYEFDHLKSKIGFALYGPPQKESGYDEKQNKEIKKLLDTIVKECNTFSKWKDHVVISFIYNCTEPLPSEKLKRSKKYKDYNPNTDLNPVPLFVLLKCEDSDNPCRIIVDDCGRVYKTWRNYLNSNKLGECEMILPEDGRYQADENGKVKLERHLSPACGIDQKILQGVDMASTVAGLVSGGVFIAAAIPALTVAPVALVSAGATGLGVGLYSIGRSAYTLYDRRKHNQSMSFINSEARGAYLNIVAGSLGFVGAGANLAVSQLVAKGFNIGKGATAVVNMVSIANIGASGISVVNSGYDAFDQWWNENQTPSMLTLLQLSSSLLFFGHAVYSFKTVGTIIDETQASTLKDYNDSLRSNRHRKTFNKMMKETIRQNDGNVRQGQSQVIKTIKNIQNKDEAFAALTRLNKQMNKNNIKFSAENGQVTLNGTPIDMTAFSSMEKNQAITFFNTLPSEVVLNQTENMTTRIQLSFNNFTAQEVGALAVKLVKIFGNTDETVTQKILDAVAAVISTVTINAFGCFNVLDKMFPGLEKWIRVCAMVSGFFQGLIDTVEKQYQNWLATKDPSLEEPIFARLALDYSKRAVQLFNFVSKCYFVGNNMSESGLKLLMKEFYTWFAKQVVDFDELSKRKQQRTIHSGSPNIPIRCLECGGVYYRPSEHITTISCR